MNIETIRKYCIDKKAVTESLPFDNDTLVYKVANKMFALLNITEDLSINLKAAPGNVTEYIEKYESVHPGYHMNKKHWITVMIDGTLPDKIITSWIDDSYNLVFHNLSKKTRQEYGL